MRDGTETRVGDALSRGEIDALAVVLRGSIVEDRRSRLIPGYRAVVWAAKRAGAPTVTISGSGPTMVAIVDTRKTDAERVARAMAKAFGVGTRAVVARAGEGAR